MEIISSGGGILARDKSCRTDATNRSLSFRRYDEKDKNDQDQSKLASSDGWLLVFIYVGRPRTIEVSQAAWEAWRSNSQTTCPCDPWNSALPPPELGREG